MNCKVTCSKIKKPNWNLKLLTVIYIYNNLNILIKFIKIWYIFLIIYNVYQKIYIIKFMYIYYYIYVYFSKLNLSIFFYKKGSAV